MKLETIIIIVIFAARSAFAQDMASVDMDPHVMDEKARIARPQTDPSMQVAYVGPEERSAIAVKARAARMMYTDEPTLYSDMTGPEHANAGVIQGWRDRVFKKLGSYARPRRFDPITDNRMQSNTVLDERHNEARTVSRIILKETLRYAQDRLPEIEELIKAMRFEVSTDMIARKDDEAAVDVPKQRAAHTIHHAPHEDRFFLKTGLRIPVEGGKLGVVSETEATYGNLSSFFQVRLDGRYDNTAGLVYLLSRGLRVQVERQVTHEAILAKGEATNTRSSLDLVRLVCAF
jgi:hypothetical protein